MNNDDVTRFGLGQRNDFGIFREHCPFPHLPKNVSAANISNVLHAVILTDFSLSKSWTHEGMQLLASSDWIEASEALRMSCSDGSVSCNAQTRQRPVHAAWLVEPRAMSPAVYKEAQERALKGQLDLVFTHEWALVRRGGPFRYCPFGTTYLRRAHHRLYNKTALVSLIASRKGHPSQGGGMQGHSMRHAAIALLTPQRLVAGLYAD
eukprot:CAMPEP_0113665864 /NCGR_PEP_ID=MMETSP0038_2-20120614/2539_1 /TAXON_ID=2898 /ORGANISM="Cryptomonas paramecium" /LENGTH=206 /DNA_ID=CAMNT_0000581259 /DNA_START=170 /DNA_END=787 /DNA_ORIENTATION=- /assembly_acc=CAM_ASM_000170